MSQDQKAVELVEIKGVTCLVCRFPEHLDSVTTQRMIRQVVPLVASAGKKLPFVWDCGEMMSYDRDARELWQEMLRQLESQLGEIHLVTESSTVRLGALAISMFTSFDVKTCKRWEDLAISK